MGRFTNQIVLAVFAIVGFFITACDNNACKENMYTPMNVQIFHKDVAKTPYVMTSVTVSQIVNNGLVDTDIKDSSFAYVYNLTLDPNSSITKFLLKSTEFRDTIIVKHSNTFEFVSAECGARVTSHIDSFYFAGMRFDDSIVVANPVVNGVFNAQNVKIYME